MVPITMWDAFPDAAASDSCSAPVPTDNCASDCRIACRTAQCPAANLQVTMPHTVVCVMSHACIFRLFN